MSLRKLLDDKLSMRWFWLPTYLCFPTPVSVVWKPFTLSTCIYTDACAKATAGVFLDAFVFLPSLSLAFAYTYAQVNPEAQMTFYIVTFRVKFLPYTMLLMAMVMKGPDAAMAHATGLLAAHLYEFLARIYPTFGGGKNYIQTPQFLKNLLARVPGQGTARSFGTAFQARSSAGAGAGQAQGGGSQSSRGWTSGFGSNSWGDRGPGRRLG